MPDFPVFSSTPGAPHAFNVEIDEGAQLSLVVTEGALRRRYDLEGREHHDYLRFYEELARDFGTRLPSSIPAGAARAFRAAYRPLLTAAVSDRILYGYGDPAVLRVGSDYYLLITSNDAPDAFPILRSRDLSQWDLAGFVFPEGEGPKWAARGERRSDFWAPEMVRVGGEFLLCFSAREKDGSLSIGIARAPHPEGPFSTGALLLRGGVIDPHLFVTRDGTLLLFWKEDSNEKWPFLLAQLLREKQGLISALFPTPEDSRTACFVQALWPWLGEIGSMERFFLLQPLIEAVVGSWSGIRRSLGRVPAAARILEAMQTPIWAQQLSPETLTLTGERRRVLTNDLEWEGHLIEGPWLTEQEGLYYLFYSGNDFSTPDYGIGVAVADDPFGPFVKAAEPLLRSTAEWIGPGHPSLALDPEGQPRLFFHAFFPDAVGYKEFRALLAAPVRFDRGSVFLGTEARDS